MRRTANPTVPAMSSQPAARVRNSHVARMTTGWWDGRGALRLPAGPVLPPPFPPPLPPLPPPAAGRLAAPPRRAPAPPDRLVAVPGTRPPGPPPATRPDPEPLPRAGARRCGPPFPPLRTPPGGALGSITASGSSAENSPRSASACPLGERADPLGARVAMMTNVTTTSPAPEQPRPGVSPGRRARLRGDAVVVTVRVPETAAFIQRPGGGIGGLHLQEHLPGPAFRRLGADGPGERRAQARPAPPRVHFDRRDARPPRGERDPADRQHVAASAPGPDAGEQLARGRRQHPPHDRRLAFLPAVVVQGKPRLVGLFVHAELRAGRERPGCREACRIEAGHHEERGAGPSQPGTFGQLDVQAASRAVRAEGQRDRHHGRQAARTVPPRDRGQGVVQRQARVAERQRRVRAPGEPLGRPEQPAAQPFLFGPPPVLRRHPLQRDDPVVHGAIVPCAGPRRRAGVTFPAYRAPGAVPGWRRSWGGRVFPPAAAPAGHRARRGRGGAGCRRWSGVGREAGGRALAGRPAGQALAGRVVPGPRRRMWTRSGRGAAGDRAAEPAAGVSAPSTVKPASAIIARSALPGWPSLVR